MAPCSQFSTVASNQLRLALSRCCKTLRSPFDKLRVNGGRLAIVGDFPFVLSLSKHESDFFRSLLKEVFDYQVALPAAGNGCLSAAGLRCPGASWPAPCLRPPVANLV